MPGGGRVSDDRDAAGARVHRRRPAARGPAPPPRSTPEPPQGARARGSLAVACLAAGLGIGCGAARPPTPAPEVQGVVRRAAGPDLARVPRSTPGRLRLALWIDAGSRDTNPPQTATLAARLAAQAGGPEVMPFVTPDGTELAIACRPQELEACLKALARALAFRRPSAAALKRERARLEEDRRRALAADPGRAADRLALVALLGDEEGAAMQPLGNAANDASADLASVSAHAAAHYGPRRALLIGAGELPEGLEQALGQAFADAPRATAARASRSLEPRPYALGVEVGDHPQLALALSAAKVAEARHMAAGIADALEQGNAVTAPVAHVFSVRGGALAILRATGSRLEAALETAGRAHARLARDDAKGAQDGPGSATELTPDPTSLAGDTRRVGMRWCAAGGGETPPRALAAGAVVPGGRADRVVDDPDLARRTRATTRLEAALHRGATGARANLEGELSPSHADARLENGTRLRAVADPHAQHAAIALRFAPGAAADSPLLHGRAALLATLATTACKAYSRTALRQRLRALGASLTPSVVDDGWGVVLSVPSARWRQGFALALDCALTPSFRGGDVVAARHALRARLARLPTDTRLWAEAARRLAPAAPGGIAPWGDPALLGGISRHALRELHRESTRGARLRVGVVAPGDVDAMLVHTAARLSRLPEGAAAEPAVAGAELSGAPAGQPDPGGPITALVGWTVHAEEGAGAGALAFATAVRAQLARGREVTPLWHGGGRGASTGWAAVALRLPSDQLAELPALAARSAAGLDGAALGKLAGELWQRRAGERAERAAEPAVRALTLLDDEPRGSAAAAASLAARLAAAAPRAQALR